MLAAVPQRCRPRMAGGGAGSGPTAPIAHTCRVPPARRLRSPFAQAVVPVVAGIGVLALIAAALWGISAYVSRGSNKVEVRQIASRYFDAGSAKRVAAQIDRGGPLLYPGLIDDAGKRPIGIGHVGTDPLKGWRVFPLVPPGAPADCLLAIDRTTRELAAPCSPTRYPPDGTGLALFPVTKVTIDPSQHLIIDLTSG